MSLERNWMRRPITLMSEVIMIVVELSNPNGAGAAQKESRQAER